VARPDENFQKSMFYVWTKFQQFPQKYSDQSRHALKKPKFVRIANLAPQSAKFVWIGPKITIFAWLSVRKQTNNVIIHFPCIPSETGYFFANTNPFSLIPFLVERIIQSVNDDGILKSHWFEQVSSVQDNKQIRNSENSSGRGVAPQS
jgi:hypothetical protein